MKKEKKAPYLAADPKAITHSIVCSQCAAKLKTMQQDFSITVVVNHRSILLHASDMLCIVVDDNYCVFQTLSRYHNGTIEHHRVRSTLVQWAFLAEYGLEQVSRNTIVNLLHVYCVKRSRIYSYFLDNGVEVTESYSATVSEKLKFWRGIDHYFSA